MMRVTLLVLIWAFGCLQAAYATTSQSKPTTVAKGKSPNRNAKATPPAPIRIDPSARAVKPGYRGEAFGDVLKLFNVSSKGEFETSAEYDARLASLPFGIYAFRVDAPEISYNADAEVMRVRVSNSLAYTERPMRRWYDFEGDVVPIGTYVAQNAYGVKAEVTKAQSSRLRLIDRESSMDGPDAWVGEFNVKAADARALKPKLEVMLLAAIDADAAKTIDGETHETTPTVSSPYAFSITEHRMSVRVAGWWIVDTSSGRIVYGVEFPPDIR